MNVKQNGSQPADQRQNQRENRGPEKMKLNEKKWNGIKKKNRQTHTPTPNGPADKQTGS